MGGLFNILGTGLKYIVAALGLVIWLGGAALAAYSTWESATFDGPQAGVGAVISIVGLLIALVGSVILLRLTKRLAPFLLCVAFGVAAYVGGSGGASQKFSGPLGMAEPAPADVSDTSPDASAASPAPDVVGPPPVTEDVTRPSAAPAPPASGSLAATEQDKTVAKGSPQADQFQVAELRFNKPSEMRLQHPYVVEATIATPGGSAPQGLGDVGPTVTRQTEITRKVRVELIANDFKIEKLSAVDTVLITPRTPGQWSWRVTPLSEGADRKMLLQVFGVLEAAGVSQGEVLIKTYEETIPVTVTPMDRANLVMNAVISSWQTIAGIFGVIGGIWVFLGNVAKAFKGKKEEPAAA